MKPEIIAVLIIFSTFVVLEIMFTSFFNKKGQKKSDAKSDAIVEIISTGALLIVTQPFIILSLIHI